MSTFAVVKATFGVVDSSVVVVVVVDVVKEKSADVFVVTCRDISVFNLSSKESGLSDVDVSSIISSPSLALFFNVVGNAAVVVKTGKSEPVSGISDADVVSRTPVVDTVVVASGTVDSAVVVSGTVVVVVVVVVDVVVTGTSVAIMTGSSLETAGVVNGSDVTVVVVVDIVVEPIASGSTELNDDVSSASIIGISFVPGVVVSSDDAATVVVV